MIQDSDLTDSTGARRPAILASVTLVCLVGLVAVRVAVQPVGASGGEQADPMGSLHLALEVLQVVAGGLAVVAAFYGVRSMRGGHMERAFTSLTAGVLAFLLQRLWHSLHEFGFVALPHLVGRLLFLVATVLIAAGFAETYRVMRPSH